MDEQTPAREVMPDARLLFVLVAVFLVAAVALVGRFGGGDGADERIVQLGRLEAVLGAMTGEPLVVADLPGVVVTRATVDPVSAQSPRWGQNNGALPLDRREALFALSLDDPADGATLAWCPSSGRFEHPDGVRAYGRDGRLLAGRAPRGMDRRAIAVGAAGQVTIDPGRWVSGIPVDSSDLHARPTGAACSDG